MAERERVLYNYDWKSERWRAEDRMPILAMYVGAYQRYEHSSCKDETAM